MIIPWWGYILGIVGAIMIGVFFGSIGFFLHAWVQNRKLKKSLPVKDKKEVSQWLKQPDVKEALLNPGNVNLTDTKEAAEDERKRFDNYREFEKLRRIGQGKSDIKTTDTSLRSEEGTTGRGNISTKYYFGDEPVKPKSKGKFHFD